MILRRARMELTDRVTSHAWVRWLSVIYTAKLSFIQARAYRSVGGAKIARKYSTPARLIYAGSINLGYCYRARLRIRIIGRVNEPSRRGK